MTSLMTSLMTSFTTSFVRSASGECCDDDTDDVTDDVTWGLRFCRATPVRPYIVALRPFKHQPPLPLPVRSYNLALCYETAKRVPTIQTPTATPLNPRRKLNCPTTLWFHIEQAGGPEPRHITDTSSPPRHRRLAHLNLSVSDREMKLLCQVGGGDGTDIQWQLMRVDTTMYGFKSLMRRVPL